RASVPLVCSAAIGSLAVEAAASAGGGAAVGWICADAAGTASSASTARQRATMRPVFMAEKRRSNRNGSRCGGSEQLQDQLDQAGDDERQADGSRPQDRQVTREQALEVVIRSGTIREPLPPAFDQPEARDDRHDQQDEREVGQDR